MSENIALYFILPLSTDKISARCPDRQVLVAEHSVNSFRKFAEGIDIVF